MAFIDLLSPSNSDNKDCGSEGTYLNGNTIFFWIRSMERNIHLALPFGRYRDDMERERCKLSIVSNHPTFRSPLLATSRNIITKRQKTRSFERVLKVFRKENYSPFFILYLYPHQQPELLLLLEFPL